MDKAATIEEERVLRDEEVMSKLKAENKVRKYFIYFSRICQCCRFQGLREMLEIACKYGSYGNSLMKSGTEDKDVQTENVGHEK